VFLLLNERQSVGEEIFLVMPPIAAIDYNLSRSSLNDATASDSARHSPPFPPLLPPKKSADHVL
jgi:hypothetical protein